MTLIATRRSARLTEAQVATILRRLAEGRHGIQSQLGREYGVSQGTINLIKQRRVWRHVEPEQQP